MPSPADLGLDGGRKEVASSFDWTSYRKHLETLGAVAFQLERLDRGGYRFGCRLATTAFGKTHPIEAEAATEAEAVQLVVQRAEQWKTRH